MAEDKIRVSGKSAGKWEVRKNKKWKAPTSISDFQGHDLDMVKVKRKKGAPTQVFMLASGYRVTFHAK